MTRLVLRRETISCRRTLEYRKNGMAVGANETEANSVVGSKSFAIYDSTLLRRLPLRAWAAWYGTWGKSAKGIKALTNAEW